jgi:peptidyl-dipeptidase Dcp
MSKNTLLAPSNLPNQAPNFSAIKEEDYLPAVKEAIAQARANIDAVKTDAAKADFDNTIIAMETSSETLDIITSIFYNQLYANGTDGLQELAMEIGPLCAELSSDVAMDPALFERVKAVHDVKDSLGLNAEQDTLLTNSYKGFVRGGALLGDKEKEELRTINESMSKLGPEYTNNVNKSSEAFELIIDNEDDLSGLPQSAIDSAAFAAKEKNYDGKWLFTLDYPSYGPLITYSDKRELREKIWKAFSNRAWDEKYNNAKLTEQIVTLRDQRAKLLGYKNHADYVLERRMAKSPDTVLDFLQKLQDSYKPAAEKELEELKAYAKTQGFDDELKPWDASYFSEKLKQDRFKFSGEDLRPYFQMNKVLDGAFTHFSKLFNIRFTKNENYDVWHNDVVTYDVHDSNDNSFIGTLYGDFFPRTGKKPGAWKTSYRDQGLYQGKVERPVIAIVCNFTKPTADKPSLLTHGEVSTLFHELGHAVHALLAEGAYRSLSGTNVLWDFVELPSQLQENWTYEKETLDLFAEHYETGEKIPAELIEKLVEAKNFMIGMFGLRQVSLGLVDMAWHNGVPENASDIIAVEDEATKNCRLFERFGGPTSASFSHIFAGGYSAGYYSYKWAEVLDADAFEYFKEAGLYNQDVAAKYRQEILSKGGSEDPDILYRRFRGRDADPDALLRRENLKAA